MLHLCYSNHHLIARSNASLDSSGSLTRGFCKLLLFDTVISDQIVIIFTSTLENKRTLKNEGGGISAEELKAGEILSTGGHCRSLWRRRVLEQGGKFAAKRNPPARSGYALPAPVRIGSYNAGSSRLLALEHELVP